MNKLKFLKRKNLESIIVFSLYIRIQIHYRYQTEKPMVY